MTSADPHVNNIVVTTGPKDERDAVSRLDQLSNPSASSRVGTDTSLPQALFVLSKKIHRILV